MYLCRLGPNELADTEGFVKGAITSSGLEPRTTYEMAICLKATGQLIGGVGLFDINTIHKKAELGYSLNPAYWGQGYVSEAASSMIIFAFDVLKLHRVEATCDIRNIGSYKVMEKCGMTREGLLRENMLIKRHWRDSYIYSKIIKD